MTRKVFLLFLVAIMLAVVPAARAADCTEPPAPGVDWQRCPLDRRDLAGQDLAGGRLTDASFERADFLNADLSGARWTDGRRVCAEGSTGQCA